jgi:hypothetical protein
MTRRPVVIREPDEEDIVGFATVSDMFRKNGRWIVSVEVDRKRSVDYPLEQARDLFPTMVVQYIYEKMMTNASDPDLAWVTPYQKANADAVCSRSILVWDWRRGTLRGNYT